MTRPVSNLRGAPLFLRPSVVRALIGDVETIARHVVAVPVLPITLADAVRLDHATQTAPNTEITRFDTSHDAPANDAAPWPETAWDWEPADWPDAPLPEAPLPVHADPDLDRSEEPVPDSHEFDCSCPPVEKSGLVGTAAAEAASECQLVQAPERAIKRPPQPDPDVVRHRTPRLRDGLYVAARRMEDRELEKPVDVAADPHRAARLIREASEGEAIRLDKPAQVDWARVAAAHRNHSARPVAKRKPIEPAPSREECPRCGVPGWKGCDHYLPCEETPTVPHPSEFGKSSPRLIGPRTRA